MLQRIRVNLRSDCGQLPAATIERAPARRYRLAPTARARDADADVGRVQHALGDLAMVGQGSGDMVGVLRALLRKDQLAGNYSKKWERLLTASA